MKIAVSGKGGAGKTTFTALLAYSFSKENKRVFLVDADPDGNLAMALGFTPGEISGLKPVVELKELIKERTGAGGPGFYKLNPEVGDIPEKYSLRKGNINLLVIGALKKGGSGCYCPENTFLKSLIAHLLIERDEVVILDMPAGIEHLGRGTASGVDFMVIIVEPSGKSIQTAERTEKLAKDLGIKKYYFVANKVKNESDLVFINKKISENLLLGVIMYNEEILNSDRDDMLLEKSAGRAMDEIEGIKNKLYKALL